MFCNKCGKQIPDASSFCNYCGNRIDGESMPAYTTLQMKCKSCGGCLFIDSTRDIKTLTCPYCGETELMIESETVAAERIRSQAYKEVELYKQAKEAELEKIRQETKEKLALAQQAVANANRDAELARSKANIKLARTNKKHHTLSPLMQAVVLMMVGISLVAISLILITLPFSDTEIGVSIILPLLVAGIVLQMIGLLQIKRNK